MDWLARLHPQAAQGADAARPVLPSRFAPAAGRGPISGPPAADPAAKQAAQQQADGGPWVNDLEGQAATRGPTSGRNGRPADPLAIGRLAAPGAPASIPPGPLRHTPDPAGSPTAAGQAQPLLTQPAPAWRASGPPPAPNAARASATGLRPSPDGAPEHRAFPLRGTPGSLLPAHPREAAGDRSARRAQAHLAAPGTPAGPLATAHLAARPERTALAEAPPTVSVHIQRLEVRLPTPPAPRPGAAPRAAAPAGVSLSDYLRGRRGGGDA